MNMLGFYFFFGVLAFAFFGAGSCGLAFGRPLMPCCFNISKSFSETSYIALTPIYRDGLYPRRPSLLWAAPGVVPIRLPTSGTDNSIYPSIYGRNPLNQGKNVKLSYILPFILYDCIVNSQKILRILEIYPLSLDQPLRRG